MTQIALAELFRRVIDLVEREKVSYVVYGGLALPAWGQVVPTKDVDLLLRVREEEVGRLIGVLRQDGFHVNSRAETLFFIDTWFVASLGGRDADFALGTTPFDESAFARSVRIRMYERAVPIVSAEDLILYKLAAYRRKDLGHIEDIIIRQGTKLDMAYLRDWARRIAEATGKFEVSATLDTMLAEQGLGS